LKRVLLITPPYHSGVVESAGRWPPLGLLYIAGALQQAGHAVMVYDAMTKEHDIDQIRSYIQAWKPDVVGTTAYTSSFYAAVETLKAAKSVSPSIVTVIGGVHPTFCYEDTLTDYPNIVDFVICGEGEKTAVELVNSLQRGENYDQLARVRGLAYRKDGKVVVTPPRPFLSDLDEFQPAWNLVDWNDYFLYFLPNSRVATVSSSRGCTNECAFCSQQKFWHRTCRERSAASFLAEIDLLYSKHKVNVFLLTDEYPTRDRQRWEEILDGLSERHYAAHFLMETCVGDIIRDADIMWKYKAAGILHVYVGVEASKQERLDRFKKDIRCEQSREAIRLINKAGLISECSFILGVPEETTETIRHTLKLAQHYNPDYAHFLMLTPWPYADMYQELKPYIEVHDFSKYNLVEPVIKPVAMTREEVFQQAINCYRQFYMRKLPQWFRMADGFRREYLIRSMKEMLARSFLKKHGHGLGKIPAQIEKYLVASQRAGSSPESCL
jgi:anaerobic magnesium-protoporphyrin IX monomethyl ester cyclase